MFYSTGFRTPNSRHRCFESSNSNGTRVLKCDEYRNYWVLINASWICLGFVLDSLDIDLLDIELSDVDLDFLPSKYFVSLWDVLNSCLEDVFRTSSAYEFFLFQDVFRRLEDVLTRRFKISWGSLENVFEGEKLLCWRRLQDVLETNKCLQGMLQKREKK